MNHAGSIVIGETETDSDSTLKYEAEQPFNQNSHTRVPAFSSRLVIFNSWCWTAILAVVGANAAISESA